MVIENMNGMKPVFSHTSADVPDLSLRPWAACLADFLGEEGGEDLPTLQAAVVAEEEEEEAWWEHRIR